MVTQIIKECKFHGETVHRLDVSNNYYRCKECLKVAVKKRRKNLKVLAVEYKGGKCELCGYSKCIEALDFHHLDPSQKDFGISRKGETRSWERTRKELDKCMMLCANCHREEHAKQNIA